MDPCGVECGEVRTHNRPVTTDPERDGAGTDENKDSSVYAAGDYRTSPTTGELEYFDGLTWTRPGTAPRSSEFLIRPVPPAEQPPADATDPTGPEPV